MFSVIYSFYLLVVTGDWRALLRTGTSTRTRDSRGSTTYSSSGSSTSNDKRARLNCALLTVDRRYGCASRVHYEELMTDAEWGDELSGRSPTRASTCGSSFWHWNNACRALIIVWIMNMVCELTRYAYTVLADADCAQRPECMTQSG